MDFSDLLNRVQQGDAAAFTALIKRYGEGVYRRAFRLSRDKQFAADITRQTMEELFSRLRDDPAAEPGAVLMETLADKHIDAARLIQSDVDKIGEELTASLFGSERLAPPRVLRGGAPAPRIAPRETPYRPQETQPRPQETQPRPRASAQKPPFLSEQAPHARPEPAPAPPPEAPRPGHGSGQVREPAPTAYIQDELSPEAIVPAPPETVARRGAFGRFLLVALLIALIAVLLWMAVGILMKLGVLPGFDLGYDWFNTHIVMFF